MKRHITLKDFIIEEDIEDWVETTERLQRHYDKNNFHEGTLGSAVSDAQRTFSLSIMGEKTQTESLEYLTQSKDIGIAHFNFGNNPEKDVELSLFGKKHHVKGVNEGAFMHVLSWSNILNLATITRDTEGKFFLLNLDDSVFNNANIKPDEMDLLWVKIQRGIIEESSDVSDEITQMINTIESGQMDKEKLPYRQKIILPILRLYQSVLSSDSTKFNSDLNFALQNHKEFWSISSREYKADGWVSIPLLAVCSIAFDKGISLETSSDYIPEWLYKGAF